MLSTASNFVKKGLKLLFITVAIASSANAQIVGTDVFLQGRYLEIGELGNGAFGVTSTPPAGYHPHCPTCFPTTALAEVYDYGKDGWTVGTPPYMGDYTYPGSPFEGWGLQVNGGRTHAFTPGGFTSAGGSLTGSITGYSNSGGRATSLFTGTAAGGAMAVRQETRVDTLASAVIVTTVMRNTSAASLNNVYYLRSCDPDNDQTWPGGGFVTTNTITYQNDIRHRVLVSAVGATGSISYMGLGTKDCRAKAFIYDWWSMPVSVDFADIYNETVTGWGNYYYNGTQIGDIGIGLIYRIGNIAPGDSAIVSYAYIFNGIPGIDEAFPDPTLKVHTTTYPSIAPPTPEFDTFDACQYPGLTSANINILFGDDKCWSWSSWTWAPAVGLATTTGVNNTINFNVIPGMITYTITGTDSAAHMFSCNTKTFYLTVITCNKAVANSPCEGDTLYFNAPGDSTGASYQWYGPAPSTSVFATTQSTYIYPASAFHSGVYSVIKTVAGIPDTSDVTVVVRHKPNLTVTSNAPLCVGAANTLLLNAITDSPVVTYDWTATPSGFTSALGNPTIPGFDETDTGLYKVIVTSVHGCKDTGTVYVTLVPPPPPPIVSAHTPYCRGDAFIPFSVSGISAGATVLWYAAGTGGTGSPTPPVVNTNVAGVYTYWFTQTIGSCESPRDSVTVVVNPTPVADFSFVVSAGCPNDTVTFTNTTVGATAYTWTMGDGRTLYDINPTHIYNPGGDSYNVSLRAVNAFGCVDLETKPVDTRNRIVADFIISDTVVCNGTPAVFTDASYFNRVPTFTVNETVMSTNWDFGDGNGTIDNGGAVVNHTYAKPGYYQVTLTAFDYIGCSAVVRKNIVVVQPIIRAVSDTTFCLPPGSTMPINATVTTQPDELPYDTYVYNWTPSVGLSSSSVSNPDFSGLGTFVYTFTATLQLEGCTQSHVVTINSVPPTKLKNVTLDTRIMFGNSIRLNAEDHEFYRWSPNDGSLDNFNINNPVATPTVTTTYMVEGMDKYGCRDTAFVKVIVDSTQDEFIPTAFTPNGDGKNDIFRAVGTKFHKLVEMRVYNRWGQQVFYSNTREVGWDGTFEGQPADMGVYYYTIIVARPGFTENQLYKGEVTLIR